MGIRRMLPLSFAKKFGLAVFGSAGIVYNKDSKITSQYLKYAGGAGIHYLLFPKKDVWTRFDVAINNEGGSGLYFYLGCAFNQADRSSEFINLFFLTTRLETKIPISYNPIIGIETII